MTTKALISSAERLLYLIGIEQSEKDESGLRFVCQIVLRRYDFLDWIVGHLQYDSTLGPLK